jgi:hypothetical protein
MKSYLAVLGLAALAGASAFGAPLCSTTPTTNNLIAGAPSSISDPASDTNEPCSVGPLTFSNFSYDLNTGSFIATPVVSTEVASQSGNVVSFDFNPNLTAGSDLEIEYEITGGISSVTLSGNIGGDGFVNEVVCTVFAPNGSCPVGDQLNPILNINSGQESASTTTFAVTTPVWIFKDIESGNEPYSEVNQNYNTGSSIPEPMTLSLVGGSLLGLGFLGRRRVRK